MEPFNEQLESIEFKLRACFESLVEQGGIEADSADELNDLMDSIDDVSTDEVERRVTALLGTKDEHGG